MIRVFTIPPFERRQKGRYRAHVGFEEMVNKSQVRFIVGKGGVGKTTLTAAIALAAAALGRRVQMIELEGRSELARSFDTEATLGPYPTALFEHESGATVVGRHLAPDAALLEWMSDHGFGRLLPRLRATGAVDIIATAVPGIRDVHELHVWTITSGLPVFSAHVVVDPDVIERGQSAVMLDQLQDCLRGHFDLDHSTFQLEPAGHAEHERPMHD